LIDLIMLPLKKKRVRQYRIIENIPPNSQIYICGFKFLNLIHQCVMMVLMIQ